jgi:hypothetical protein
VEVVRQHYGLHGKEVSWDRRALTELLPAGTVPSKETQQKTVPFASLHAGINQHTHSRHGYGLLLFVTKKNATVKAGLVARTYTTYVLRKTACAAVVSLGFTPVPPNLKEV